MVTKKNDMTDKAKKWINDGRNPGIAHWHGALEATMASFAPYLQPGRLIPVHSLDKSAYSIFKELYTVLDLCPDTLAAFIPSGMAGVLYPPAAIDSLRRIHKDNKSVMLLCRQPGENTRILSAEISKEAWKPGVDLFEEGALLGSYEFDSSADCIRELPKLVRTHLWRKEKWTVDNLADYTLNWFTRVVETGGTDAPVQPDFSYIHSPVLLNLNTVEAVFKLVNAMAARQHHEAADISHAQGKTDAFEAADDENRHHFLEGRIIGLLNSLRDSKAVDFAAFTPPENERFKDSFSRAVATLDKLLGEGSERAS